MAEVPNDNDYDSPWKDALDWGFPDCLALLFPEIHRDIDWSRGYTPLDKELQQVARDGEGHRRYVDKLMRVYRGKRPDEAWLLVHIEVQGDADADFARRMFRYYYRLLDRYDRDIISVGILTDLRPGFRPHRYHIGGPHNRLDYQFPIAKLIDFEASEAELLASDNPFALVVLAQLRAKRMRDGDSRRRAALQLIRLMYERGYNQRQVLRLFHVIDWMMALPAELEAQFLDDVHLIEKETHMPYINTAERAGLRKGLAQGREEGRQQGMQQGMQQGQLAGERELLRRLLTKRFGILQPEVEQRLEQATTTELERWAENVLDASTLDAVFNPPH